MSNVVINDTNLVNIADAIRLKTGSSATYLPSEMANAIGQISGQKPEQTKTATENGTITPDSGYVLSSVTVAIPTYTDLS